MKQTVLKKNDSTTEDKVNGNVLISAYNYKKDFRVKYCMINHSYSVNIETLFSASIEQVVKIIEQSDNIYNTTSLKELMHRKGLNIRFEWAVLAKLRINQYRDMVMIDILLRVMRKIINEEVRIKAKVSYPNQQQQDSNVGNQQIEDFYQGNQIDSFKEILIYYMNALLGRKYIKQKQVFDETLLGLFLSRMSILGIVFSLNLRKEEFIYLESKDILDDIVESPSKNPILFVNAVQTYFNIEFKPDFLRICRQDKNLLLSKNQPVTVNDIKLVGLRSIFYFSIREQAYFMLARQITYHSKQGQHQKAISKIKTKGDKDKLRQSFQKPSKTNLNDSNLMSQSSHREYGIGPHGLMQALNESSTIIDHESKTVRNRESGSNIKESQQLNTIRQYKNNFDKSDETPTQLKKNGNGIQQTAKKVDVFDLSKLASKKNTFKPTQVQEIILPPVMYKLKTYLKSNPMYYFDDHSKTYVGDTLTVLKSYYEMPNYDVVNEWVICMESLLKDVVSVSGSEQVLLEAFVYQAILTYFFETDEDGDGLFKVLTKVRDYLFVCQQCAPEILVVIQILTGIFFEKKNQPPLEAEKSYLTALMCITQQYGDPRGRGNISIPYVLFLSWKLSLLALCEDKKLHDSEFAEEIFDACLKSLFNHKKLYKDQQLQQTQNRTAQGSIVGSHISSQQQIMKDALGVGLTPFEIELERQELIKQIFDIRKYRTKPQQVTVASGKAQPIKPNKPIQQRKQTIQQPLGQSNYQTNQPKGTLINGSQPKANEAQKNLNLPSKEERFGSKSQVVMKKKISQKEYEIDISDIDLDIEDENKNFFVTENFKNNEWYIGTCPFQHWSLYRQEVAQILIAHTNVLKNPGQANMYQKEAYKKTLQKLPQDMFYQWMIKFNPIMYRTGVQWNNQTLKEVIFNQNQQMVSSSGSSVVLSNQGLSHQSLSSLPSTAKEKRNMHLGSYSQIIGKECGGISKQDMSGIVYTWGTDSQGQLGLDSLTPSSTQNNVNVRVYYPRMVVSLRDEIIKEICCGHSHTLCINIHGQVFCWGNNESGQLGLGPDAPFIIRRPIINNNLQNIVKLSAGNEHSLALNKTGELYSWGCGGLTGLGDLEHKLKPQKMTFFNKTKIQLAVCGGLHSIAVTKDGELYSWGSTEGGQLGLPLQMISDIVKGKEIPVITPQKVPKLEGIQIIQVACGEAHTIAMAKDGEIYGWGMSNYGQLGLGFSSDSFEPGIGMEKSKVHEPSEIVALKQERIQKLYCGATFTLFQTDKGDLYGCGMNDLGQLGLDTFMEDMSLASLDKAKKGRHHQTSDVIVPTKVICFQSISLTNVACGENHALAVSGDDKNMLWAWGMFKHGQLGLGEVNIKMNPRPVQTLCSSVIQRIACGSMHSQALIGDTNNISTFSAQYYSNNEAPSNIWQCDMRGLNIKEKYDKQHLEEEVPNDGEGKIKNPK